MNFFQSQDDARKSTKRLVLFFALAVISLVVITNLFVMLLFGFVGNGDEPLTINVITTQFDWQVFLSIGALVAGVILCGSIYKTLALSSGGVGIAESLGGRLLDHSTDDLHERKVLNVVEEMAIASGTPVPPVYLLDDEEGINAFAAGFSAGDAVIGVTRGTIAFLSREELQGVIAHEFSHILHGDMRLNIRLIGILHGILLIGLIGYYILRSTGRSRSKDSGAIVGLGIGLLVIGYTGTFFGNLIKASVSRQREFLADASAVQFTRNPAGISGALKKIGGYDHGSELEAADAPSMSHAYFSSGVTSWLGSLSATHPPLDARISRVDPSWDGVFEPVTHEVTETETDTNKTQTQKEQPSRTEKMAQAVTGAVVMNEIINSIGHADVEQLNYAATLIHEIPENIRKALYEPYAARAVIYCLLIDKDKSIQEKQFQHLKEFADDGVFNLCQQLFKDISQLDIKFRLPLVDIALPILRRLSKQQYQLFKSNLNKLIAADNKMDIFEWSLQKILTHNLEKEFSLNRQQPNQKKLSKKPRSLNSAKKHIEVLISMLIYTSHKETSQIKTTLTQVQQALQLKSLSLLPREQINFTNLNTAIDTLNQLKPLKKPSLLKACLICVTQDNDYSAQEKELIRAISNTLDCPIPLFIQ